MLMHDSSCQLVSTNKLPERILCMQNKSALPIGIWLTQRNLFTHKSSFAQYPAQAQSWANNSQSSRDRPGQSTETAVSSHKRSCNAVSLMGEPAVKRSRTTDTPYEALRRSSRSASPQSPDRCQSHAGLKKPARLKAAAITTNVLSRSADCGKVS